MVVFLDLDGTLLNISRRYYRIHRYVCRKFALVHLPFMTYWSLKRKADQTVEFPGVASPELRKECWDTRLALLEQRRYLTYDTLVPGAKETLKVLGGSNSVVLVTLRRNLSNLRWQLNRLGLNRAFHGVLARGEGVGDGEGKLKLIKESEWHPQTAEAIIVGDSEADVFVGKSLGIATYCVSNGIRSASFLQALGPTLVAPDIRRLPDYLRQWTCGSLGRGT